MLVHAVSCTEGLFVFGLKSWAVVDETSRSGLIHENMVRFTVCDENDCSVGRRVHPPEQTAGRGD